MKTRSKLLSIVLLTLILVFCVFGLTSCGKNKKCSHKWGDWSVTANPTCSETGVQERVCQKCKQTEQSPIETLAHTWEDATCTSPKTCKVCSATEGTAKNHAYTVEKVDSAAQKSPATCASAAVYYKSCACGAIGTEATFTSGSALSHADTNKDHVCDNGCGKVLENCVDKSGDKDHKCDVCGKADVSAHTYGNATCDKAATCSECGATTGSALGHKDENKDHVCDNNCGKKDIGTHADSATDGDHVCDYGCGAVLENCTDAEGDQNHDCDICGKADVSAHAYGNADCETAATCSECGATTGSALGHKDENKDHVCDNNCGKKDIGTHADSATDGNHVCDYGCGAILESCVDKSGDNDHKCDVCGKADVSAHTYGDSSCEAAAICSECGATTGSALGHKDENKDHVCDRGCGKKDIGTHADSATDGDHVCDYGCGAVLENCTDSEGDQNHACDICGKADVSAHAYGSATCETAATCSECGATTGSALGHKDENKDHVCDNNCGKKDIGTHADSATDGDHVCDYGCGAVLESCVDKSGDKDHKCDVCGKDSATAHDYGEAACEVAATCKECGETRGSALGHEDANKDHICDRDCGKKDMGTHADSATDGDHVCDYGCGAVLETCVDKSGDKDHKCDVCGKANVTSHTYGNATCETAKTCSECGATTGSALGHKDEDKNHVCDRDCGKTDIGAHTDSATDGDHLCDYGCGEEVTAHTYGNATCEAPATCTDCGATNGYELGHKDDDKNHICDRGCGKTDVGVHADSNVDDDHLCDHGCGAVLEECYDTENDGDHVCDACGAEGLSAHVYGNATCGTPATCRECGATDGEALSHEFVQEVVKIEAQKSAANCSSAAVYYKSCSCGAISDSEDDVFTSGTALGHTYDQENIDAENALKSEATCTSAAVYYKSCSCGAVSESDADTFTVGSALDHTYDNDVVDETTLKSAATCTEVAVYYKSCSCGAVSTDENDTFENGETAPHEHVEISSTEATCLLPATRTYQCSCGDEYTENDGAALDHDIAGVTAVKKHVEGCEYVLEYTCKRGDCGATVTGETVFEHKHIASITTPATCEADGVKTLTCSCGDTKTETIPADKTGHHWVEGEVTDGVRTDTCSVCSETKEVTVYTAGDKVNGSALADKEIDMGAGNANLTIDQGVADVIGEQDVTISADKLEGDDRGELKLSPEQLEQIGENPVYNFTIAGENGNISDFGENNFITITLPYELQEGEDVDSIAIWFVTDEGQVESFRATYSNGYVTFQTNHFSCYTVTRLTPSERCELYGHGYVEQVVAGSCTKDAYILEVCVRCHDKKIKEGSFVSAPGHNYTSVTQAATCTASGKIVYTCTNKDCGHSYETKLNATGHNWTIAESLPASCEANGFVKYACANEGCDRGYEITSAKLAHVYTVTVVPATCETAGYTLHDCDNCEYSYTDAYVAALGHAYTAQTWTWAEDNGSATLTIVCGNDAEHVHVLEANIGTTVESWICSGYVKTTYLAAVSFGTEIYTDEKIEEVGTKEHPYSLGWKSADGVHWRECLCGEITDRGAHAFGNSVVTTEPTCTEAGESTSRCVCGETRVSSVPATGRHSYVNGACASCGMSESACDHKDMIAVTVDLSEFGACDGTITYYTCACGEVKILEGDCFEDLYCDLDESEYDFEELTDGSQRLRMVVVCYDCGLRIAIDATATMESECIILIEYSVVITVDDVSVLTIVSESVQTNHDYDYTYEKFGETCEDGYSITGTCAVCGAVDDLGEGYGHSNEWKEISSSELGFCSGTISETSCGVCGRIERAYLNTSCSWYNSGTNENGDAVSVCYYCGVTRTAHRETVVINSCKTEYRTIYTCVKNGEEIYVYATTSLMASHDYKYEFELQGNSCADGYIANGTCRICGETGRRSSTSHETYNIFKGEDVGLCAGHYVNIRVCPCGDSYRVSWDDYTFTYNDETQRYECSDCGCSVLNTMETVRDGCHMTETSAFVVLSGDTELWRYEREASYVDHRFSNASVSEVDGMMTIVVSCSACGESTSTSMQSVDLELHEDGRYYYDYIFIPETTGSYTILGMADRDTYVELFQMVDGELVRIGSDDDSGSNGQFLLTKNLEAGTTYVYRIRFYSSDNSGTIPFSLTEGSVTNSGCNHNETIYVPYLPTGSTSCEDGAMMIRICAQCGTVRYINEVTSHDNYRIGYAQLSDHGVCGNGYVTHYSCACGQNQSVEFNNWCSYTGSTETTVDENGNTVVTETYTCRNCGLVRTVTTTTIKDGCTARVVKAYSFVLDENELFSVTTEQISQDHSFDDITVSEIDGVLTVVSVCKDCGETKNNTIQSVKPEDHDGSMYYDYIFVPEVSDIYTLTNLSGEYSQIVLYRVNGEDLEEISYNSGYSDLQIKTALTAGETYVYRIYSSVETYRFAFVQGAVQFCQHKTYKYVPYLPAGSTSCEDGAMMLCVCAQCGYTRRLDKVTSHSTYQMEYVQLSGYGVCGGSVRYSSCACGQNQRVSFSSACSLSFSSETTEDEHGNTVVTETYTCQTCGLIYTLTTATIKDGCTARVVKAYSFVLDENELFSVTTEQISQDHSFDDITVFEIDGLLTVVSICSDCGESKTHMIQSVNPENHDGSMYYDYIFVPEVSDIYTLLNAGGKYANITLYRVNGEDLEEISYNSGSSDLQIRAALTAGETYIYRIQSSAETFRFTFVQGAVSEQSCQHNENKYVPYLPAGSTSCEDGAMMIRVCTQCGNIRDIYDVTSHSTYQMEYVQFADYGVCGGNNSYAAYYSCACGQNQRVEFNNWCSSTGSTETTVDENGNTVVTETYICQHCGLVRTVTTTTIKDGCTAKVVTAYVFMMDENELFSVTTEQISQDHSFRFVSSETDGVPTVTADCAACGAIKIVELHSVQREDHDGNYYYGDYTFTPTVSGSYTVVGMNDSLYVTLYKLENGEMVEVKSDYSSHFCLTYDLTAGETYVYRLKTDYSTGKVFFGFVQGTQDVHTCPHRETKYITIFSDGSTSCTDGVIRAYVCVDCGIVSSAYETTSHDTDQIAYIELSQFGVCGNGYIRHYSCGCGYSYSVDFYNNDCNYEWSSETTEDENGNRVYTETRTCRDCGFVYMSSTIYIDDGCIQKQVKVYSFTIGETEIYSASYERAYANHSFGGFAFSTVDGVPTIASSCTKCGETKSGTVQTVVPEEHEGEYYYDYVFTPDVTGSYTMRMLTPKDKMVTLYKLVDGELEMYKGGHSGYYTFDYTIKLKAGETYVYRIQIYNASDDNSVRFVFGMSNESCNHNQSFYLPVLHEGAESCEDGVQVFRSCTQCGSIRSVEEITSHNVYDMEKTMLADYGVCGENSYIRISSCACGQQQHLSTNFSCHFTYSSTSARDDEGRLVYVETSTCLTCGFCYERTYYTVRDYENCKNITYYTVMLTKGDTLIDMIEYTSTETVHDYDVTATLVNGAGSSCTDGVTLFYDCKYCDYGYESGTNYYHSQFEKERVNLADYGSVCGGYFVLSQCACGASASSYFTDTLCEWSEAWTTMWIDGVLTGSQLTYSGGWNYFDHSQYILSCAVTDPACGMQIRYATYWLKDENSCTATQYRTYQFGYDAETGECLYELTWKTGSTRTYHNYVNESENNNTKYDCADCGSYYYVTNDYDDMGRHIKQERHGLNALTGQEYLYISEWTYDENGNQIGNSTYEKSVGSDGSWTESRNVYEPYTGSFGDPGQKVTSSYINSNGNSSSEEYAYVNYKGYSYRIYTYSTNSGSWSRYDYAYSFENGCVRTTTYTCSDDATPQITTTDICKFYSSITNKVPTCTQDGEAQYCCVVCEKLADPHVLNAYDHNWVRVSDNWYYCGRCALENANGASGDIILEDLTEAYGNGENYVVGYAIRNNVMFSQYVTLILSDGAEILVPDVAFIDVDGVRAIAFNIAAVDAWAAENGYTDYDVRLSFVPDRIGEGLDYGITFTETIEIDTIVGNASFIDYIDAGETKSYTITPTEDGTWTFTSFADADSYGYLYDAEGNQLTYNDDGGYNNNFQITYELKAGETYTVSVRWYYSDRAGYIPLVFVAD